MKKLAQLLSFLLLTAVSSALHAQGVTLPQMASQAASVSQHIGLATVEVIYSRPAVKGRTIWGDLVPYGWNKLGFGPNNESPWRAGANENTTISFSHDVKVNGQPVPAGKYGLFFVINKDDSGEAILSKDNRSWGSFFYDKAYDQLRTNIRVRSIPHTELLTYDFLDVDKNGCELVLNWEKKQFPLKLEFATDDIIMSNADQELKGALGFGWQGPLSAANYALQNHVNTEKALMWADQALAQNKSFNTMNTKAGLLRQAGKTAEADKLQKDALMVATETELNQYGYQLLNQNRFDEAIKVMVMNTDQHPDSANAWDSLGEAYALKGDKPNAIASFKKALSKNPPANVKANSEKYLKQLGGM